MERVYNSSYIFILKSFIYILFFCQKKETLWIDKKLLSISMHNFLIKINYLMKSLAWSKELLLR